MRAVKLKQGRYFVAIATGLAFIGLTAFNNGAFYNYKPGLLRDTSKTPAKFGFGRVVSQVEIDKWDIDIRPDGKGLPPGEGDATKGKVLYTAKCAICHGATGEEVAGTKLPGPALVSDTAAKSKPKTIGNYWPYATTLFDYTRRTMPYNLPGSLTDNEVYSVVAYLLSANKIIKPETVLDAKTLPLIVMPARKLYIPDDREGGPEVK